MESDHISLKAVGLWLVMLLMVLCLTMFVTLALMITRQGQVITQRAISYTKAYYEADEKAIEKMSQIDEMLIEVEEKMKQDSSSSLLGHLEQLNLDEQGITLVQDKEQINISYTVPCGEKQFLKVKLQLLAPTRQVENQRYEIVEWVLQTKEDKSYDMNSPEFQPVIGG